MNTRQRDHSQESDDSADIKASLWSDTNTSLGSNMITDAHTTNNNIN